jgi:uncharacterized protein (TIGR01244 family)
MDRRRLLVASGMIALPGIARAGALRATTDSAEDGPFVRRDGLDEAPFGDRVSGIRNYARVAPYVATAGALDSAAVGEAKALGFGLLIDLRRTEEDGVAEAAQAAQSIGIARVSLPLRWDGDIGQQIDTIAALLNDSAHYPVLLHCASGNRAGAVWALYRARMGVPPQIAIEEGRTAGMASTEAQAARALASLAP